MFKGIHHLGISQTRTEGFLRLYSDPTDSVPLEYNHVLIMYFFFLGHHRLLRGRVYPGMCVYAPEKAMAPHSSTLAWKIPWTEEPGRLQSMGLLRVGHD